MSISNGFDIARVVPALTARVGWQQPTNADFDITLDATNLQCLSQRYFNFEHPSCSAVRILEVQENPTISGTDFNSYLTYLKKEVAMNALASVFVEDALIEKSTMMWEKQFRTGYITIPNAHKFCGLQLKMATGDYGVKIESLALQFSAPCTVTIYLYNDLRKDALWSHEFTITKGNDQQIFNLNDPDYTEIILNRLAANNKGGVFWIGYYQDEIEAQGVTAADNYLNWWASICLLGYQSFEAVADYANHTFVRTQYTSNYRTYGVNLQVSGYKDYTNQICGQPQMFDNLQRMMMAYKCITDAINSNRLNADQRNNYESYLSVYNQMETAPKWASSEKKIGLATRIENEIQRLQDTFIDNSPVMSGLPPVNTNENLFVARWGYQI